METNLDLSQSREKTSAARFIHLVATSLMCLLMFAAIIVMLTQNSQAQKLFTALGYPAYLIYPLAFMKLLGITAIISKQSKTFMEWAYAGFLFTSLAALASHIVTGAGSFIPALMAIVLIITSYISNKSAH